MMTVHEKAQAYDALMRAKQTPEQLDKESCRTGAARPDETCEQRNMRMGWGCKCHGMTFCPDPTCVGYDNDVPVFVRRGPLR